MTFWESWDKDKARIAELERERDRNYDAATQAIEMQEKLQRVVDAAREVYHIMQEYGDAKSSGQAHKQLGKALRELDQSDE